MGLGVGFGEGSGEGPGVGAGVEDSRNAIPAALAAIEELRPLVVELENVANIRKYEDVVSGMFTRLASLGYHVSTN